MLGAPGPVGDIPFAFFVGSRMALGIFFFWFFLFGIFFFVFTTTLAFQIEKTNLARLHSDPFAA